jgi:hypothetical protein
MMPKGNKQQTRFTSSRDLRTYFRRKIKEAQRRELAALFGPTGVFRRKLYNSPSSAASAVSKRAMDGWWWWRYEAAPGEWMRLKVLKGR